MTTRRLLRVTAFGTGILLMVLPAQTVHAVSADGGNTTDLGGYRIHVFTNSGTLTVAAGGAVDVLVVAGGGGGGGGTYHSGGGGAGGLIYASPYAIPSGSISITVGGGGSAGVNGARGGVGGDSVFSNLTAIGGGGGANYSSGAGMNGGSGGGATYQYNTAGTGVSGQGMNGGLATIDPPNYGAGGGGGAGGVGGVGTSTAGGNGGVGLSNDISGVATYYAGGGGGSTYHHPVDGPGTPGSGGNGGGGAGSTGNGTSGTPNTGGGGGGAERLGTTGGAGGSGIVIVRYPYDSGTPGIVNLAATNVTSSSAYLNGDLTWTGAAPLDAVAVYWGTNDGLNIAANWSHTNLFSPTPQAAGPLTTNITGLLNNTLYYYRYYATNSVGETWASPSATFITGADANTWYVTPFGSDTQSGTSWQNAFLTVSNGIAHAQAGETVLVWNGVYNIGAQLVVSNAIVLQGFAGAGNTLLKGPYPSLGRVLVLTHAAAVVDGFTITNGYLQANPDQTQVGGGVYMSAGTLRNCVIEGNRLALAQYTYGGGIYAAGGLITNCVIRGNTSEGWHLATGYAGGVYLANGSIVDCRFERNLVKGSPTGWGGDALGGGLFLAAGTVWNCLFTSNRVQRTADNGGDMNSSYGYGSGAFVGGGALINCTLADNVAVLNNPSGGVGAGVYNNGGGVTNVIAYFNECAGVANDFYAAAGTTVYSCAPELTSGTGNLTGDPLFINRPALNYHLQASSVALDAGTNLALVTRDLDGNPRPLDGDNNGSALHDMGCYEFVSGLSFVCNFSGTPLIGVNVLSNAVFTATVGGPPAETNITSYTWDFGNGIVSGPAARVVTNTFGPGIYTVTLTVTNSLGQGTNAVKTAYIQVLSDTTYVSTNGTATFPYDTWAKATTNVVAANTVLFDAINAGAAGGEMWISNGVYMMNAQLTISQPIRIHGVNGAAVTQLRRSGAFLHRILSLNHASALVEGLTLTNGLLTDAPALGGGVYLGNGILRNCSLLGNQAFTGGGVAQGGGVYMLNGLLSNCVVMNGMSQGGHFNHGWGGGVYVAGGTVRDCRIEGNLAKGSGTGYGGNAYGGGIAVEGSAQVLNCVVASNRAQRMPDNNGVDWSTTVNVGGGAYISGGALVNVTVVDNYCVSNNPGGGVGAGIYQTGGGITNCIVSSNTVIGVASNYFSSGGVTVYSCAPELTSGTGNITSDPLFARVGTNAYYRLLAGSPGIEGGANLPWMNGAVDLAGNPRILMSSVDMGAYEFVPPRGTVIMMR